jgi:catechol 2,3-dioxygenase-like lactoylglutathione lyase family enzyme
MKAVRKHTVKSPVAVTTARRPANALYFRIAGFEFVAFVVSGAPTDQNGWHCEVTLDTENHRIMLFEFLDGPNRLRALMLGHHQAWRHLVAEPGEEKPGGKAFTFGISRPDLSMAGRDATAWAMSFFTDLQRQGGQAALDRLHPDGNPRKR